MPLTEILIAIGGGLAALYAGWKKYFSTRKKAIKAAEEEDKPEALAESTGSDVLDALTAQADIYSELNVAMRETGADRMLLLFTKNGGDRILYSGVQLYATVFAEVYDQAEPVRGSFQARPLYDPHYIGMLRDLARDKKAVLVTDQLHADMVIKGVYERSGLREAHVYLSHVEPGKIWYISAGFKQDPAEHADTVLADCAARIGTILQRPMFDG